MRRLWLPPLLACVRAANVAKTGVQMPRLFRQISLRHVSAVVPSRAGGQKT
jgi:hypothetical protein